MVKIKYIDNIHAVIEEGLEHVQKILEFEKEYWQQGRFSKQRMTYQAKVYTKKGQILAGLVPIVKAHCTKEGIDCEVVQNPTNYPTLNESAEFPGITLRPEQLRLVQAATEKHRGILKGFTGVGKSYILAAILNRYPEAKFLILVHAKDLARQLSDTFKEFSMDVGTFTGEKKEEGHRITVGTIQTCCKFKWDVQGVCVDEVHHISGPKTQYAKLLSSIDAPIRLGFSATPKTKVDGEGFFASTGALGPIIDEVNFQEGKDRGQLIPVKLKFIKVPINHDLTKITKYNDFIQVGIVNNNRRNKQIVKQAHELSKQNKSSLILITKTEHGCNLRDMAEDIYGWKIPFVSGSTSTEERNIEKNKLKNKNSLCIIASVIFTEGINIESLDSIFLADVGKKESKILQCVGRGLRSAINKDEVLIFDFLDLSSKYSVKQLGERLLTYSKYGWL